MKTQSRLGAVLVAATVVGLVFAAARAQAAPGDLDPTFSGNGKQTTDFGGYSDGATDVALQSDGKIVAVGFGGHRGNFALARYKRNGRLDPTFSGDGKKTTDFAGRADGATGVAIQDDGKIVAVGATGHARDFALARYKPSGSLDPSFSGNGKQTTVGFEDAEGVALQADGKIVVVGSGFSAQGTVDFAVARYKPNGSLDPTFSGDGKQTTDFSALDGANGVAVQGNGKIVVVGRGDGGDDFVLARYKPNGALDRTFSGDGKQTTDFDTRRFSYDGANAVVLQGDGKIIAAGFGAPRGAGDDFALARYNANGSLDTSFSGNGKQTTDLGGYSDGATDVALQSDGKIVAVGCACGDSADSALARYKPNGALDTTFSGDGKQTTDFGDADGARGVGIQIDSKIVAVGAADGGATSSDFALARYLGG